MKTSNQTTLSRLRKTHKFLRGFSFENYGELYIFTIQSMSVQPDPSKGQAAPYWHPTIDCITGEVFCTCPDFRIRKLPNIRGTPTVFMKEYRCKHIDIAIKFLQEMGNLP